MGAKCSRAPCCNVWVQHSSLGCGLVLQSSGVGSREAHLPPIDGWQVRDERLTGYRILFVSFLACSSRSDLAPKSLQLLQSVLSMNSSLRETKTESGPQQPGRAWGPRNDWLPSIHPLPFMQLLIDAVRDYIWGAGGRWGGMGVGRAETVIRSFCSSTTSALPRSTWHS